VGAEAKTYVANAVIRLRDKNVFRSRPNEHVEVAQVQLRMSAGKVFQTAVKAREAETVPVL